MGFIRNKESFQCLRCGNPVEGDGYTNHCPKCLFSRHVDISPGDRAATCREMMEPVSYFVKSGEERILHRCVTCGFERENRVADEDDRTAILGLIGRQADFFAKEAKGDDE
jgi:ribosomal protein L37E